jgi:BNR repeat-like domain
MRQVMLTAFATLSVLVSLPAFGATYSDIHDVAPGGNPVLTCDQKGNSYAAFEGHVPGSAVKGICFSKSSDSTKTWTVPVDVSKTTGYSKHPAIAVEKNGAIDVVWSDTTSGGKNSNILFARSADGGKVWSQATDISHASGTCSDPSIAAGSDNSIHVVWKDTSCGVTHPDIYYGVSIDGGQKWAKPKDVSNTPGVSNDPTIAVSGDGIVHVAWLDSSSGETHPDIYYTWNSKGTWNKLIDVSNSPKLSAHPSLACGVGGKIYLAWCDNSQKEHAPDIWCAVSVKPGEFSKPLNLSDTPGVSSEPKIAADSTGRVVAVWSDTSNGVKSADIFAAVSFDSLKKVSAAVDVTNIKGISKHPSVALGADNMVLVWEEIEGAKSTVKSLSKGFPRR